MPGWRGLLSQERRAGGSRERELKVPGFSQEGTCKSLWSHTLSLASKACFLFSHPVTTLASTLWCENIPGELSSHTCQSFYYSSLNMNGNPGITKHLIKTCHEKGQDKQENWLPKEKSQFNEMSRIYKLLIRVWICSQEHFILKARIRFVRELQYWKCKVIAKI